MIAGVSSTAAEGNPAVPNPDQQNSAAVSLQASELARQGIDYIQATWNTEEWMNQGVSKIQRMSFGPGNSVEALCFSATDPICREKTRKTTFGSETALPNLNVFLGPCASAADVGCIEDVAVGTDGTPPVSAAFVSSMATELPELPENVKMRVPRGSTAGLWRTPSGSNYMVRAVLVGPLQRNYDTKGRLMDPVFNPRKINLVVDPVTVKDLPVGSVPDEKRRTWSKTTDLPDGSKGITNYTGMCTPTQCLTAADFGPDERIRLAVRIPNGLETWLTGRIDDATVRSERLSGQRTRLTVEGDALATYHAGGAVSTAAVPADLRTKYFCPRGQTCVKATSFSSNFGYEGFLELEPYFGLRSSLTRTRWEVSSSFSTILGSGPDGEIVGADCMRLETGLVGIVGTNAAVFDDTPPAWNANTGQLSFRIASPHLAADGNVAGGRYTLAVPPEVAQCFYGRSALPPAVEVTVTEDNGTTRTETVTVSNDGNWVRFAVSGFTFSSPRIAVKLGVGTSIKVGGTLGASAIRSAAGLTGSARLSVSVTASSAKVCRVRGTSVSGLKKGVCVVRVRSGGTTRTLSVLVRGK